MLIPDDDNYAENRRLRIMDRINELIDETHVIVIDENFSKGDTSFLAASDLHWAKQVIPFNDWTDGNFESINR